MRCGGCSRVSRVLIVDEDPADGIMAREALLEHDPMLEVEFIRDADEALCSLISSSGDGSSDAEEPVRLVIVGVRYPGSNGCQFLRRLRGRDDVGAIPVVVLTERLCEAETRRACEAGGLFHIRKPVGYREYKAILRGALLTMRSKRPTTG